MKLRYIKVKSQDDNRKVLKNGGHSTQQHAKHLRYAHFQHIKTHLEPKKSYNR